MLLFSFTILSFISSTYSSVLRRQDPGLQQIPANAKADNAFNNGAPQRGGEPDQTSEIPDDIYGARSIDLPFYRLFHGNMGFFAQGQLNSPDGYQDHWIDQPGVTDSANQSACGIPDNAWSGTKVAIHPYFLKYADLSRYCMQDVCISFWKNDGSSDMMLKVTDICSTDPNDPAHCASPTDIKVDRGKAMVMEGLIKPLDPMQHPELSGNGFPDQIWWFFMKCWDDGLVQPAYSDNWFATPSLPNNLQWAQKTAQQQYDNNQASYPGKGWDTYPNGGYVGSAMQPEGDGKTSPPITDWSAGDKTPEWSPVAGGEGWGNATTPEDLLAQGSATIIALQPTPHLGSFGGPATSTTPEDQSSVTVVAFQPTLHLGLFNRPESTSSISAASSAANEPSISPVWSLITGPTEDEDTEPCDEL